MNAKALKLDDVGGRPGAAGKAGKPAPRRALTVARVVLVWLWTRLPWLFALGVIGYSFHFVYGPTFKNWQEWGSEDWDAHGAYRYITVIALQHGEFPWFSPWFGGGFPAWSYSEGATNVVSPYFFLYLFFPLQVALRLEAAASTLVALFGAFALTRRFTRSVGLATFVGLLFVMNSRWSFQFNVGHTWHFQYAWLPWILFFYDRSCRGAVPVATGAGKKRDAVIAGLLSGLLVTMGGIYPAPHAALVLGVYCVVLTFARWSFAPVGRAMLVGVVAIGLAAPKLIPMLELLSRFPRAIASDETVTVPQMFDVLISPKVQPLPIWGWHEYGAYIGGFAFLFLLLGTFLPSAKGTRTFRILGVLFVLLSLGTFHQYAPWTLLHKLPLFSSQHVPSRFIQVAFLLLGLSAAAAFGALLDWVLAKFPRVNARYRLFDAALVVLAFGLCKPMLDVSAPLIGKTFTRLLPPVPRAEKFQHARRIVQDYVPTHWGGALVPSMLANTGVYHAYGVTLPALGPRLREDANYRGEAYFQQGGGKAEVTKFAPSSAEITYASVSPGALLVYNMNYDPGWTVDGQPAVDAAGAVGVHLPQGGAGTVRLKYRPPGLYAGLAVSAFVLSGFLLYGLLRQRRARIALALSKVIKTP